MQRSGVDEAGHSDDQGPNAQAAVERRDTRKMPTSLWSKCDVALGWDKREHGAGPCLSHVEQVTIGTAARKIVRMERTIDRVPDLPEAQTTSVTVEGYEHALRVFWPEDCG